MLGAISYAIAGTDVLQVVAGIESGEKSDAHGDTKSEAKRLSERLMPFLLGGLRAALPSFEVSSVQKQTVLSGATGTVFQENKS
jgi:hypothetical protein